MFANIFILSSQISTLPIFQKRPDFVLSCARKPADLLQYSTQSQYLKTTPQSDLIQNKLKPASLGTDLIENERYGHVFVKTSVFMPKTGSINSGTDWIISMSILFPYFSLKGTVSWDRFQKFWQKFTELGLTKGHGWFLNFLWASMILKYKKFIYCS